MEILNKLEVEKDSTIFRNLLYSLENQVDLHSLLPFFCLILFGNEGKEGILFKKENSRELLQFLDPRQNFFLKLQNNLCKYGMNLDALPFTTRKWLREGKYENISFIYKLQGHSPKVMFNMVEYFIFSFAYAPVLAKFKIEQMNTYYDLISLYLGFVLPNALGDGSTRDLQTEKDLGIYGLYK